MKILRRACARVDPVAQSLTKQSWQRLAFVTYEVLFLKKLLESDQVFRVYQTAGAWPANGFFGEFYLGAALMQNIPPCDSRDRTMNVRSNGATLKSI